MRENFSTTLVASVLTLILGSAGVALAGETPTTADLAASLKATEEAFARTMADRDHAAFESFLAEDAVFFGRRGEIRGKAEVAAAWLPLFEGPQKDISPRALISSGSRLW